MGLGRVVQLLAGSARSGSIGVGCRDEMAKHDMYSVAAVSNATAKIQGCA